jgi:hypothetical protein
MRYRAICVTRIVRYRTCERVVLIFHLAFRTSDDGRDGIAVIRSGPSFVSPAKQAPGFQWASMGEVSEVPEFLQPHPLAIVRKKLGAC